MKIAFPTSGNNLGSELDGRFGRAPKFLLYETDNETIEVFDNKQNLNTAQGAGIQSAERVIRLGAKALITGHCGPKAFKVLSSAGVKIFTTDATTIVKALDLFRQGELLEANISDVEGHWV